MSDSLRHDRIVALLNDQPFASVRDLQQKIGVSGATIRRDIEKLHESGRARKVYGGVAAVERAKSPALPFVENRDIAVSAKEAIAREAEKLVRDGSSIIIHGGSTCFHFGRRIANRNLRVFTNSMPLAAHLAESGTCQLTVGGGDLHRDPGLLYDSARVPQDFFAAQFFVGALGISEQGVLEQHPILVRLANEMSRLVPEVILLADSRKFHVRPPTVSLPLQRLAKVVTDDAVSDADVHMLERAGVEVIIAKVEHEP